VQAGDALQVEADQLLGGELAVAHAAGLLQGGGVEERQAGLGLGRGRGAGHRHLEFLVGVGGRSMPCGRPAVESRRAPRRWTGPGALLASGAATGRGGGAMIAERMGRLVALVAGLAWAAP